MTSYASLKKARDARKSKRRAPNSTLPAVAPTNQSRKKKLGGPRRKQPPARNSARRKSEWARAYGSKERVAWMRRQPCIACGVTPSENAHVGSGGMGRKSDAATIVPLCRNHHRIYHNYGPAFVYRRASVVDLDAAAAETQSRWEEHLARKAG